MLTFAMLHEAASPDWTRRSVDDDIMNNDSFPITRQCVSTCMEQVEKLGVSAPAVTARWPSRFLRRHDPVPERDPAAKD